MLRTGCGIIVVAAGCLLTVLPARAYVDLAPTLARVIHESQTITLVEVDAFSRERGAVILKKVRDLKGETGKDPLKHEVIRAGSRRSSDQSWNGLSQADGPWSSSLARRFWFAWVRPGIRCITQVTAGGVLALCARSPSRLFRYRVPPGRGHPSNGGREERGHHHLAAWCRPGRRRVSTWQ